MRTDLACIILAAGKGTRMRSALPKVMHPIAGQPMIQHVVKMAKDLGANPILTIVGDAMDNITAAVAPHETIVQSPARGTGDAVWMAQQKLQNYKGNILVLYGDVPMVPQATLEKLIARRNAPDNPAIVVLGFQAVDPSAYGRLVIENQDRLQKIVEYKDASESERAIDLCNSGLMVVDGAKLWDWIEKIDADNAQKEFYLTDIVKLARSDNQNCAVIITSEDEVMGVNSRAELARAEKMAQSRLRHDAMKNGVTLIDPETVYFSADTRFGPDITIHPNVVFGPHVTLKAGVEIFSFSHLEGVLVESNVKIGPFARIRPGSFIGADARVGNFVEIKNASLEGGAKINHLSYIGDARIGTNSNVGAGTVTCNYDGFAKHKTDIGANSFIGSNSIIVAPVTIGDNAMVAAGSVVTDDVPSGALAIARSKQTIKDGWMQKFKDRKKI